MQGSSGKGAHDANDSQLRVSDSPETKTLRLQCLLSGSSPSVTDRFLHGLAKELGGPALECRGPGSYHWEGLTMTMLMRLARTDAYDNTALTAVPQPYSP